MCPVLLFAEYPSNGISLCVGLHTCVLNPENLYIKFCFALQEFEKKKFFRPRKCGLFFSKFLSKKGFKNGKKLRTKKRREKNFNSASHITIIGTILPWKNLKKSKFQFIIYAPKMDKNHLQGLKNLRKNIFNVLEANLDENLIFEKKVTKFTLKYRNFRYF